jgi:phosphoribosylanthranilate isomerase
LRGGTGETFDWTLVQARRSKVPLILSGGLGAENVAEAIALTHPYAVDTASGTEASPGRKDPEKLSAFFDAVRGAAAESQNTPAAAPEPTHAPATAAERQGAPAVAVESPEAPDPAAAIAGEPA